MLRYLTLTAAAALAVALAPASPAAALSMKECGAKYQAAKQAGTLKGMKWNDFRKAECADEDATEAEAAAAEKEEAKPAGKTKPTTNTTAEKPAKPTTTAKPTAGKGVSFPSEVSSKYADESPGKARMHTCLDQYRAIKEANGGTAPVKWIEKGGGYYSQCNTKLKS